MASYSSSFSDIVSRVVEKCRLDATLDATRVSEWINQVLCDVAVRTRYFSGSSAGTALAANATSQNLPSAIIELEQILCVYGGNTTWLTPVTFEVLLRLRQGTLRSGPPQVYSLRKDTVELFPAALGTEVLTYYGATLPDEFTTGSSGLPEPFNSLLLEYGACVEASDFKRDQQLFAFYQAAYERQMTLFFGYLNRRKTGASQSAPLYLSSASTIVPHDPSSDIDLTWG